MTSGQWLQLCEPRLSHLCHGERPGLSVKAAPAAQPVGTCQVLPEAGGGAADLGKQTPIKQQVHGGGPSPAAQAAVPKSGPGPGTAGAQELPGGRPVPC